MHKYKVICRGIIYALAIPLEHSEESLYNDYGVIINLETGRTGTGVSCMPKVIKETGTVVHSFTGRNTIDEELAFWFLPDNHAIDRERFVNL